MSVDAAALEAKIKSMYPEIEQHGLGMSVHPDEATGAWMVKLTKGGNTLETHVEKQDAEGCIDGKECVYLTTQIASFVEAYCLRGGDSCDT